MAGPYCQEWKRGVGRGDDDVGHVVGVVEGGQEVIGIGELGVLIWNDFGNRLGDSRLLRWERADCDIGVL